MLCIGVAMLLLRGARHDDSAVTASLLTGAGVFVAVGVAYALGLDGLTSSPRLLGLVGVLALGLVAAALAAASAARTRIHRGGR